MQRGSILLLLMCLVLPGIPSLLKAQSSSTADSMVIANPGAPVTILDTAAHYTDSVVIGSIIITGNNKTKDYVIDRELPFKQGDNITISELVKQFAVARQQLINTKLFHTVLVFVKRLNNHVVDVQIDVRERWYIIPVPYFKPIDRNLSAWADKNYSLSRVNYGLKFYWENFTGRNDRLKLWLITGYTQEVQFSYDQPYADKTLKHGYGIKISYSAQKELNAFTSDNKQIFIKADSLPNAGKYLNKIFTGSLSYYYRPAIYSRHIFRLGYTVNTIDKEVAIANPDYFKGGATQIAYPEIGYTWKYQNIDYSAYPGKGRMSELNLTKKGFSNEMNVWQLSGKYTQAWPLGWKSNYVMMAGGSISLPFDQPFINQRMFGYGDMSMRGLEKYVVDGVAGVMMQNTVRRQLFDFNIRFIETLAKTPIPIKIYAKAYGDLGYSHLPGSLTNSLQNKLLYTYGAGMDLVTLYDLVFRVEYSCNQLGEKGFFFHVRNDF